MIKIAYVSTQLPSYYAAEYDVVAKSTLGLSHLAELLGFELVAPGTPVVSRADARAVAHELGEEGVDLVLLQNSTFAMGDIILEFARLPFRLALWATEEPTKDGPIMLNNFVSMNLNAGILTRYLHHSDLPFKWFYGSTDHAWFRTRLEVSVRALTALKRLSTAKVALIGGIAPTFYNLAFDERTLQKQLGAEVTEHELSELFSRAQRVQESEVQRVIQNLTEAAHGRVEVSERDMRQSAATYLSLRGIVSDNGYDALAVSDWPAFQTSMGIHPGMAFSWLDEHDGIPVASEGDVLGALSMLLMREVSQASAMLLDMNDVDEARDAVLMWHCGGSPLGFANDEGVRWKNHSTLGRKTDAPPMGAVADLTFAAQAATVLRIADDGRQLFAFGADIIESPHRGYDGSRGWLTAFAMDGDPISLADLVNTIMVEGIEHHFVLGHGRHDHILREFAAWADIAMIGVVPYKPYLQRHRATRR